MRQEHEDTLTHKDTSLNRPPKRAKAGVLIEVDTEAGMLPGISRERSIRSSTCWFTEFCNSQCSSHFAAPFIVVRAETSVAESCVKYESLTTAPAIMGICNVEEVGNARQRARNASLLPSSFCAKALMLSPPPRRPSHRVIQDESNGCVRMILPQVHLRKPCYDFSFL